MNCAGMVASGYRSFIDRVVGVTNEPGLPLDAEAGLRRLGDGTAAQTSENRLDFRWGGTDRTWSPVLPSPASGRRASVLQARRAPGSAAKC